MDSKLLAIDRVTKSFPGVRALDDVSLDLERGEIHAVLGQNGAGKSTLMHVLAGVVRPDTGRILMEGREVEIRTPSRGQELGISIVHQELSVFPSRDVAENIFVGRLPTTRLGFVDRKTLYLRARRHLDALEVELDPKTLVRDLSFSYRQLVEIAKALSYEGKVLILDEPTSALTAHETGTLLRQLRRLKERGIGIIYVTHRLREIFAISDRITVLRDGRVVGTRRTADVDADTVISMMVRHILSIPSGRKTVAERNRPMFRVQDLTAPPQVRSVNFQMAPGEIIGLAGLAGAGQAEIGRAIAGLIPFRSREITLDGHPAHFKKPWDAMRQGVVYLPADRRREGLFLRLNIEQNIVASSTKKLRWGPWMDDKKAATKAGQFVQSLSIRTPSLDQSVFKLSGGNQQKVLLARALSVDARIIVADEPTRGIDVGAKAEIYDLLRGLADQGKAVLLISTELPEILAISDRIVVMHEGRVAGELSRSEATEERVMAMAAGQTSVVGDDRAI
jgi:ribose transport system ATP-binding protein